MEKIEMSFENLQNLPQNPYERAKKGEGDFSLTKEEFMKIAARQISTTDFAWALRRTFGKLKTEELWHKVAEDAWKSLEENLDSVKERVVSYVKSHGVHPVGKPCPEFFLIFFALGLDTTGEVADKRLAEKLEDAYKKEERENISKAHVFSFEEARRFEEAIEDETGWKLSIF